MSQNTHRKVSIEHKKDERAPIVVEGVFRVRSRRRVETRDLKHTIDNETIGFEKIMSVVVTNIFLLDLG